MPSFDVVAQPLASAEADMLLVGAYAAPDDEDTSPPGLTPGASALAEALGVDLGAELVAVGFDGSVGAVVRIPTRGAVAASTVLVAGLGARDEVETDHLRRAAAAAAGAAERVVSLALDLDLATPDGDATEAAQAVTEGLLLGAYRYGAYRTDARAHLLADVAIHSTEPLEAVRSGVAVGEVAASAAMLARDLVNTPPQDKRPPQLADRVVAELEGTGVEVRVLDEQALAEGGYGGLLGVGQGSTAPPRLVEMSWIPEGGGQRHVALVGKGITFDTGGISLKPSTAMETMKLDMAGAAAVAATVRAAAALNLPVRVTGLLACAENMPSGTATRVSDVLTIRGGTTVEVINTDAEGRLVLADALVHASELEPDVIVDVATLTGAAAVALGDRIGALIADDDALADALLAAAADVGEPLWRLPLASKEYGEELKGDIADLKNAGWKGAGTVRAGLFLHEFVGEGIPWAHLDIAAVSWAESARGYLAKGGTGVPVRTLLSWLRTA